jgi:hypothetical protein
LQGKKLLSTLVQFSNLCLAGRVPHTVRPVFFGASLCALTKKSGGVRPIAVGSTLSRLVSKAACSSVKNKVVVKLASSQLGFGIRFGAGAAVHAARSFLLNIDGGHQALLKIDFANAFNTLRCDEMLFMVHKELPELYPFIYSCYSDQSFLQFGQYTLTSDEGQQQGDPLGPLLYCMTTMCLVQRVQSQFNVWFMDDGTLGGNLDTLLADFDMIVNQSKSLGLTVSTSKCELITDNDELVQQFRLVAPDIKHVKTSAAMLLRAPVGGEQSVVEVLTT